VGVGGVLVGVVVGDGDGDGPPQTSSKHPPSPSARTCTVMNASESPATSASNATMLSAPRRIVTVRTASRWDRCSGRRRRSL
jgi:hypothetical protein